MKNDPEPRPRGDAVLQNAPEALQAELWRLINEPGVNGLPKNNYEFLVKWLKDEWDIKVSLSMLSRWREFYSRRLTAQARERAVLDSAKNYQERTGCSDLERDIFAQRQFSEMAIADEDLESWVMVNRVRHDSEKLALEREKLKFSRETQKLTEEFEREKIKIRQQAEARAEKEFSLARDRFQFDAAKAALKFAAELKTISGNKTLSDADKVNAARAKLFGST